MPRPRVELGFQLVLLAAVLLTCRSKSSSSHYFSSGCLLAGEQHSVVAWT